MALEALQHQDNPSTPVAQGSSDISLQISVSDSLSSAAERLSSNNGVAGDIKKDQPNYIGILNEFCQKKGTMHTFEEMDRSGPSHVPLFVFRATVGPQKFHAAKGKTIKRAKNMAAFLALKELQVENPDFIQILAKDYLEESGSENSSVSERSSGALNPEMRREENGAAHAATTDSEDLNRIPREQASSPYTEERTFLHDFDNITELNTGGYGTVYKARKILDTKYYVVKKVKLQNEKSVAEVQALASLEHANIVRYYHSWTGVDNYSETSRSSRRETKIVKEKCLFIQMEYCQHGTLKSWIDRMEKIDKNESLKIFKEIIEGVVYIHSKKLIHRDLKPLNIFVAEELKIKIGDFGLVTPMTDEHEEEALHRTQCIGTLSYMAPEQKGTTYENEVDIFPLGLILFELLWKYYNFSERNKEWTNIRNAQFPKAFVEQYPAEALKIKLMLSEDPKKRPKASDLKNSFGENSSCQSFLPDFDDITHLATGGYGTVYKARKILDKRYYVVKIVKRRNEKSIAEVQTLARLQHENIIRYYHSWTGVDGPGAYSGVDDSGEETSCSNSNSSEQNGVKEECLFIQMEYCPFGTLKSWLEKMKMVDRNKSLEIFRQVIEGVVYIHSQNLIHRDLKPSNILFVAELKIKIGDFGLVTPMTDKHEEEALHRTKGAGTPPYLAPEQIESIYENEVDIFPLGLILFELLCILGTDHERYVEFNRIRVGTFPKKFAEKYPTETSAIKLMLSEDPKRRPKASDLHNYFRENSALCSKTC
ncbi:hypothetical protein FKM82_010583 [Ascaphus truei]